MDKRDQKLDRLLGEAFPEVGVSRDFTLQMWRRLIQPRPMWKLPVPVAAAAAVLGIVTGMWTWTGFGQGWPVLPRERIDLFGNAPVDSVAGNYLRFSDNGGLR